MKKETIYRKRKLSISYQPTKEKDFRIEKEVVVDSPQFTESTYDVGFEVLRELGTTAYSVYMAILSYRNVTTNDCHPSINRIHEDFGMAVRTIKDNIDKLYTNGYLNVNSGHKNISNNYYFPKEYWFSAWNEDFNQNHAERRKNGIKEKRRTKADMQKEIEDLKKQLAEAKYQNNFSNDNNDDDDEDEF